MEKEYIAGEPQRYEIGNRVFIVEPRYDKNGESMSDILLKLMMADVDEKMWNEGHREKIYSKIKSELSSKVFILKQFHIEHYAARVRLWAAFS